MKIKGDKRKENPMVGFYTQNQMTTKRQWLAD